jgi:hypothetical protein
MSLAAGVSGCAGDEGGDETRQRAAAGDPESGLPAPEGAVGSVTGMPAQPGPGTVPLAQAGDAASGRASISTGAGGPARTADADDDGGLHAMAVETDYPEVAQAAGQDARSTAPPPAPVIIVPESPRPTPPPDDPAPTPRPATPPAESTASTTFVTEVPVEDDGD